MLELATDPWSPNYGCFVTDWGCQASQTVAGFMASIIRNLGDFIGTLLAGAFNSNLDQSSWDIAHSQFLFWIAVTAPIVLIVALVQIGIAMILQNWQRIGRVAAGAVIAIPFCAIAVWGMQQFSTASDGVTQNLTTAFQGGDLSDALLRVMGIVTLPQRTVATGMVSTEYDHNSFFYNLAMQGASSSSALGAYVSALGVVALMAIASLFLFIAMSIREFGLLALAAMAPLALMMVGQPKLEAWAHRWITLTVGLLLAKPLAAGVVLLAVELTKSSNSLPVVLTAGGAVVAAAFSPLWATRLVSFAGVEAGAALHQRISIRNQVSRASTAAAPARAAGRLVRVGR